MPSSATSCSRSTRRSTRRSRHDRHGGLLPPRAVARLEDDPPAAVEKAVGLIEKIGRAHGVEHPIQMTVATTDGASIWAFRYSSEGSSRSLFFSTAVETLRAHYPDLALLLTSPTRRASSSRSRSASSRAPGTRVRSRATASSRRGRTSYGRSRRAGRRRKNRLGSAVGHRARPGAHRPLPRPRPEARRGPGSSACAPRRARR